MPCVTAVPGGSTMIRPSAWVTLGEIRAHFLRVDLRGLEWRLLQEPRQDMRNTKPERKTQERWIPDRFRERGLLNAGHAGG